MALISPLCSRCTVKVKGIIFLIFISNLLLLYLSKFSIFNFINILSVLMIIAAAAVAAANFTATKVYKVIVTCVRAGFLSLFIISFIF